MNDVVYHLSERGDITFFEPRPAPRSNAEGTMVWAVDAAHLHNYLLPRDCPRVTFYATPTSDPLDVEELLGVSSARHIVAIEAAWLPKVRAEQLYCYHLPGDPFECVDAGAGYWITREAVTPMHVEYIDDVLGALLTHDVELRIMPSLWPLHRRVVASSLQFSMIRMRNAKPE